MPNIYICSRDPRFGLCRLVSIGTILQLNPLLWLFSFALCVVYRPRYLKLLTSFIMCSVRKV